MVGQAVSLEMAVMLLSGVCDVDSPNGNHLDLYSSKTGKKAKLEIDGRHFRIWPYCSAGYYVSICETLVQDVRLVLNL